MPLTKVTSGVIAANAVVDSFGTQSITGDKIGLTAINANNIVNGTITGAKIATGTITGDDIATGQITGNLLTANCVTSNNIVSVSGSVITANTIANSAIQTGAIENYMRGANLDFGMRNRIINGAMTIDQRNAGANTVISTNAPYTVDRWRAQISQHNGTMNVRQDSTSTEGFVKSLRAIVTAANTSLPATSVTRVWTNIEGFNVADLGFGTANAKTVTLSFFVRSSNTGTFSGSLTNYDETRSYPFEYTINTANTFERKIITIPGDTTSNWSSNTEGSFALNFNLGSGTSQLGTANAWTGSWKVGTTGSFSLAGVLNATWYLTGVQLEEGSTATAYEYRQYGTELALCQRYYWKYNNNYIVSGFNENSSGFLAAFTLPTQMRSAPTMGTDASATYRIRITGATVAVTSLSGDSATVSSLRIVGTTSGGLTAGQGSILVADTNRFLDFSAEL